MDTTTTPNPAPFDLDTDPRPLFAAATATAAQVIGAIRPDQLTDSTPCPAYDVRGMLGHMVSVLPRIAAMGRGLDPMSVNVEAGGTVAADDAWLAAWSAGAADARDAWTDDASLERTVVLPWATDRGAAALLGYVSEITVHTWDVAHATGQKPEWNDEAIAGALGLMRTWLPGEHRAEIFAAVRAKMGPAAAGTPDAFAEVVAVPADAPLIDQLVAWNGRRP